VNARWFLPLFALAQRWRWRILIGLAAAVAAAGCSLRWIPFDNSLEWMLPAGSRLQRIMRCLQGANFADKIAISLELQNAAADKAELLGALDRLSAELKPPLITRVETDFSDTNTLNDLLFFMRNAPQILDSADLAAVERQLTPAGVKAQLKKQYLQLLKPEGSFLGAAIRADPLEIRKRVIDRIAELSAAFGYDAVVEGGHLLSRDGRHALLVAQTPVSMTDTKGSRDLCAYLGARLERLPSGIRGDIVCGHIRTVSNEDVMRRDIGLTVAIESAAFLLLFLVFFRDGRAIYIFFIPAVAGILAVPLTWLFIGRLSYLIVGLGAVVGGIAVDYGIHVYVAVRHNPEPAAAIRQALPPMTHSALMIIGIFAAFFFSTIPGYRQLAWFAILSIVLAIFCALFILPQFLRPRSLKEPIVFRNYFDFIKSRRGNRLVIAVWVISLAVGIPLALRVPFDSDLIGLDGTRPDIVAQAEKFYRIWGKGVTGQALAVVTDSDAEAAAERSDLLFAGMQRQAPQGRIASLSRIWPAYGTRVQRAQAWSNFWANGHAERARDLLAAEGATFAFVANAFQPFFEQLYAGATATSDPADNVLFNRLRARFVQSSPEGYACYTFFPDAPPYLDAYARAAPRIGDAALLISRHALSTALSEAISRQIVRVTLIAVGLVVLGTFLFIRNIRLACVSLIPVLTAIVWLLAVMAGLGIRLNVANLIAGTVVSGMIVDYGVFVTHCCWHRLSTRTDIAITLSSATTAIGTGVLLFAQHPALYSIGLTLVIGVLSGYLSAMLVVPAFHALLKPEGAVE
jgi:predicted exporter